MASRQASGGCATSDGCVMVSAGHAPCSVTLSGVVKCPQDTAKTVLVEDDSSSALQFLCPFCGVDLQMSRHQHVPG